MSKHIPIMILNDQGGDVMNVDDNVTSTLRAQDHGHPPVVCFAECNSHLYISKESSQTIRAESHGALPIVCMGFDVYNMQNTGGVSKTLNSVATDSDHVQVVCFEPGILRRDCSAGNRAYIDICSTLRAQMGDNQPAVCYESK